MPSADFVKWPIVAYGERKENLNKTMSKKASEKQEKIMSKLFRGKGIFKPLDTGRIDERVSCVREYVANIFFYTKNGRTIMIDAGYNYPRIKEKIEWLGVCAGDVKEILVTHQDTDHVGAVEEDSDGLFSSATLYVGEKENLYLTGEKRRKVFWGIYTLPQVKIPNKKILVKENEVFYIGDIKIEAIPVFGHTLGHLAYLIDDKYLFTGDAIWLGADGGYSFLNVLAHDNKLGKASLAALKENLLKRNLRPVIITGHTGWTDNFEFAFAHIDKVCNALKKQKPVDPTAPYDGYDERSDTEEKAKEGFLKKAFEYK